jgi:hypothetical protein
MVFDPFAHSQTFVQLPPQHQTAVGGDARSLEIDLQRSVEGELKWLVVFLTHWVWPSRASALR